MVSNTVCTDTEARTDHEETHAEVLAGMREAFRQGRFEAGLAGAVEQVDAMLVRHFPLAPGQANPNELPDAPHLG